MMGADSQHALTNDVAGRWGWDGRGSNAFRSTPKDRDAYSVVVQICRNGEVDVHLGFLDKAVQGRRNGGGCASVVDAWVVGPHLCPTTRVRI
jgi:hypothetical protein